MKTSIFNMTLTLPPLIEMTEVEKEMNVGSHAVSDGWPHPDGCFYCQETDMKTSIFNMNFTLPPMVEMVEVEKDMPTAPDTYKMMCGQENT